MRGFGVAAKAGIKAEMPHWVVHDLRWSFVTHLHQRKIPPHVVETIVNHVSGYRAGVAGVYNRADYWEERESAMTMWGERIKSLIDQRSNNIIPLRATSVKVT